MSNNYNSLFTNMDYDYIELGNQLGEDWVDNAWKNDSCPKYSCTAYNDKNGDMWYDLWFDCDDPDKSENRIERKEGELKKFGLTNEFGEFLFQTDDWEEMKKAILEDKIVQNDYDKRAEKDYTDRHSEG
jgi:hypothetical protein